MIEKEDDFGLQIFGVILTVLMWVGANITDIIPEQRIVKQDLVLQEEIIKSEFQKMCERKPGYIELLLQETKKNLKATLWFVQ